MEKLSFKTTAIIVFILLMGVAFIWLRLTKPSLPSGLLSHNDAQGIVLNILKADPEKNSLAAYLYPEVLKPKDKIKPWDDEAEDRGINEYTWLAWIDRDPGNMFFAHDTQFVYINARSGEYEIVDSDFWPIINEEPFTGDLNNMITTGELPEEITKSPSFPGAGYTRDDLTKLFAIEANAQTAGRHLRITTEEENAPPGEYYAVIVSGFGKNAWVFLDGAHLMYQALTDLGYDDNHIIFLAPHRARIPDNWDRQSIAQPPLEASDLVDERTSPTNFSDVLRGLQRRLTERDSLFVFMLTHGQYRKFAMGAPVSSGEKMGVHDLRRGSPESYSSGRLADMVVDRMKLCELMILLDSCYAGTHESFLRDRYDPEKIKRMQVAHSTNEDTLSYGADYRDPATGMPLLASLDVVAPQTPTVDPNPEDRGGEFSSGFIANMGSGIFSTAYNSAYDLDAARLNNMTYPYIWMLGEEGPCITPTGALTPGPQDQPQQPQDTPPGPQDQPQQPAPEPVKPKKKITVIAYENTYIPYDQLRAYDTDGCECCDEPHYHARNGVSVTTLDGRTIPDPFKDCGFGKVSEKPVIQIEVDE
jgi:hypothetical protein